LAPHPRKTHEKKEWGIAPTQSQWRIPNQPKSAFCDQSISGTNFKPAVFIDSFAGRSEVTILPALSAGKARVLFMNANS
jgi:hypothetical protein